MTEIIFVFIGALTIMVEVYAIFTARKVTWLERQHKNGRTFTLEESRLVASHAAVTALFFIMICLGLFTSQWFVCLLTMFFWTLEIITVIKQRFKLWYIIIKHLTGFMLALFMVLNMLLLHIDVAKLLENYILGK